MTKFTKTVLTTGLIIGTLVGFKYGYEYLDTHGYFDSFNKNSATENEIQDIEKFLNEDMNIGLLQYNYENLDINKVPSKTITYLLNNIYQKGSNDIYIKLSISNTKLFNEYHTTYLPDLLNRKICYDAAKMNEHIKLITNQYLDAFESDIEICFTDIKSYIYMIDVDVNKAIKNNNVYTIDYTIKDAENLLYMQEHKYSSKNIKSYKGTVTLYNIDNRYIFVSNKVKNAKNLY